MSQPGLFLDGPHDDEALAFLRENPTFWPLFVRFALELVAAGRARYGAKAIVERVRWHTAITCGADFKVNNNYTATFARLFAREYPEHADLFVFRGRRAA